MRKSESEIEVGDEFNFLTVLEIIPGSGYGKSHVRKALRCMCACGNEHTANAKNVLTGHTQSCGCHKIRKAIEFNTEHGMTTNDPLTLRSWQSMIGRTTSTGDPNYRSYGNVGIRPCKFIEESPVNLVAVIGSRPSEKYSLDRFPNPNGGYDCGQCEDCRSRNAPLNVRWATRKEQLRNLSKRGDNLRDRHANRTITAFGKTMLLCEWAELTGMAPHTITTRIDKGKKFNTPELALSTPDRKGNCYKPT